MKEIPVKRALISVSDKTGAVDFARALTGLGVEIISTGGTASLLRHNNINITEVSAYTGFPEIMDGRVKTLHPKIHGGILGRANIDDEIMQVHDIRPIDLVAVNLYPFRQTVAKKDVSLLEAMENIDIGGPAMLRAAAKNYRRVTVLVDHGDYSMILNELRTNGAIREETRFNLAVKTFAHTASYDGAISNYLSGLDKNFPQTLNLQFNHKQELRYGENPHQKAAFYSEDGKEINIANSRRLQGKELSFNNIADADAALECVKEFTAPGCVIVKHANPCGVAVRNDIFTAYERAYKTDPTSAFGGIIAFNRKLDEKTAGQIIKKQFVELIIAPQITGGAQKILGGKPNIRVMECGYWEKPGKYSDYKRINGGLLVQDADELDYKELNPVSKRKPEADELADLKFAWKVAKYVKSNAIVYAKDHATVGVGAGQMSRVYSAIIADIKARDEDLEVKGSVMASDAFFPFRDGIDAAAKAGIRAVIQPGGSMRDNEVIQAADEHDLAMVFTGMRHFRH